jgi:hypothetical protein
MKVTIPLIQVLIRRDANTITPTAVPAYELPLLRVMFGKEHITDITSADGAGQIEVESTDEQRRLAAKYGFQKIIKTFGDDEGERLTELVERAAVTPRKEPAAPEASVFLEPAPQKSPVGRMTLSMQAAKAGHGPGPAL